MFFIDFHVPLDEVRPAADLAPDWRYMQGPQVSSGWGHVARFGGDIVTWSRLKRDPSSVLPVAPLKLYVSRIDLAVVRRLDVGMLTVRVAAPSGSGTAGIVLQGTTGESGFLAALDSWLNEHVLGGLAGGVGRVTDSVAIYQAEVREEPTQPGTPVEHDVDGRGGRVTIRARAVMRKRAEELADEAAVVTRVLLAQRLSMTRIAREDPLRDLQQPLGDAGLLRVLERRGLLTQVSNELVYADPVPDPVLLQYARDLQAQWGIESLTRQVRQETAETQLLLELQRDLNDRATSAALQDALEQNERRAERFAHLFAIGGLVFALCSISVDVVALKAPQRPAALLLALVVIVSGILFWWVTRPAPRPQPRSLAAGLAPAAGSVVLSTTTHQADG